MVMGKKIIHKIFQISTICIFVLFAAFFVRIEVKASTKSAYQTYVNKHFSAKKYPYLKCILYDINKDGTQEMIVRYESGVRNAYQVYTYKKGKVKKLHKGEFFGAGGIYHIKGKKELIISFSNGASDNEYCSYKIKGGKLKKARSYRAVYDENTQTAKYYSGKKKISKTEYDRFETKLKEIPERSL